jgi:hypothetical protein
MIITKKTAVAVFKDLKGFQDYRANKVFKASQVLKESWALKVLKVFKDFKALQEFVQMNNVMVMEEEVAKHMPTYFQELLKISVLLVLGMMLFCLIYKMLCQ